jgi:hypothetical protein
MCSTFFWSLAGKRRVTKSACACSAQHSLYGGCRDIIINADAEDLAAIRAKAVKIGGRFGI